jgi:putative aminopeptidase FrvX
MTDILPFLKELISAPGLSGHEDPAARIIEKKWRPLVNEISRGKLGSLHGLRRATLKLDTGSKPIPSVMIATHMDAIGLMVTGIVDGFLRITSVGGVDPRILPGQQVEIHSTGEIPHDKEKETPLYGVVVQPPSRLLPANVADGPLPIEYLLVDTGLPSRKVAEWVRVGDVVSFGQPPLELSGEALAGHTLDNRASVAALTVCLEELLFRPHAWDVWAVASTQEEVGAKGAYTSAFEIQPTMAIAVDVTWAKGPGASDWSTFPLGKGPTIVMGPNIHPGLHKAMQRLANSLEIPHALEYTPTHSGTDGYATQVAMEGIPTLVMGLPLRYMHTPVEVVAIKDIERLGRLLAEFISGLAPDFMERIVWDD